MNGFHEAGLSPFNPDKVLCSDKVLLSLRFAGKKQPKHPNAFENSLAAFEDVLGKDKVMKFLERFDEGYDT